MNTGFFGLLSTNRARATSGGGGGGIPTPDILWWPLNDPSGTTITASVGPGSTTSTGTLNSDYLAMAGANGNFSSSSSVTYGTNLVSVSFWFRMNAWTSGYIFRSSNDSTTPNFILYQFGGTSQTGVNGSSGAKSKDFSGAIGSLSTWYHIVLVFDNTTAAGNVKMFVNGSEASGSVTNDTKAGTGNFASSPFEVKQGAAADAVFDLDDFRIYSGELTGTQISNLYAAGRP